jgi:hypothetical protein
MWLKFGDHPVFELLDSFAEDLLVCFTRNSIRVISDAKRWSSTKRSCGGNVNDEQRRTNKTS